MGSVTDSQKKLAAEAAAELVESGMVLGLGTGSTVAHLLPLVARRRLAITCVATSPATAEAAHSLGLDVRDFVTIDSVDLAIDGADQVDPRGWLVKGGGGALTREKIVASAARRFVVIVSSDKLVVSATPPVPLELSSFGLAATMRALGDVRRRNAPPTPDHGVLADYWGPLGDLAEVAALLSDVPGVVQHGLFPPTMVDSIIIGTPHGVERWSVSGDQVYGDDDVATPGNSSFNDDRT